MEHVDFLPERIKAARARRRRRIRQVGVVACCALLLTMVAFMRHRGIASARAELAGLQRSAANMESQLALRASLEQQQADLMVKKRIDDQLGSRAAALDVLSELGQILPAGMTLNTLVLDAVELRQGVQPSGRGARPVGKDKVVNRLRLMITGLAPGDVEVANFIGQLSASPLFEDVTMGYARNVDFRGNPVREFQVSCYVIR